MPRGKCAVKQVWPGHNFWYSLPEIPALPWQPPRDDDRQHRYQRRQNKYVERLHCLTLVLLSTVFDWQTLLGAKVQGNFVSGLNYRRISAVIAS